MHDFKFIRNSFFCERVSVASLAKKFKTPLYIYSHKTIVDHFHKLRKAFSSCQPLICYSLKANSNLALAKILVNEGAGVDIVSGGELFKALKTQVKPQKIVYASVGKTEEEISEAIKAGILFFNIESDSELRLVNRLARKIRRRVQVAIRINPDVEPKTHRYITTGKLTNKFGLSFKDALDIFINRHSFSHVNIGGIHIHIGSQIIIGAPFVAALRRVLGFVDKLRSRGIEIEYLNIGGGLGIIYKEERPQTAEQFSKRIVPSLKKSGLKVILEPGRFIVGNAGILVTKVIHVKKSQSKTFIIVDAGMNDLIRPALYEAYHQILPLRRGSGPRKIVDIVGPICESGDFFAKHRLMPKVRQGDLLAIMSTGAYGFSMASNYNSRPRPAEVLVKDKRSFLIRERESVADLIKGESIPAFLRHANKT